MSILLNFSVWVFPKTFDICCSTLIQEFSIISALYSDLDLKKTVPDANYTWFNTEQLYAAQPYIPKLDR